jgi:hypothetical protein
MDSCSDEALGYHRPMDPFRSMSSNELAPLAGRKTLNMVPKFLEFLLVRRSHCLHPEGDVNVTNK